MKISYRKARISVLVMTAAGLAILLSAGLFKDLGSPWRTGLIWVGVGLYLAALVIMLIGFRCPSCGAHFFKSALFLASCPACGYKFPEFDPDLKAERPAEASVSSNAGGSRLPED